MRFRFPAYRTIAGPGGANFRQKRGQTADEGIGPESDGLMTRIVLYTQQPVLAVGLQAVLQPTGDLELAAVCTELADLRGRIGPDADVFLVEACGEVTIEALGSLAGAASRIAVVLWTDNVSPEFASQAISVGARGIVPKRLPVQSLFKVLREIGGGGIWVDKGLSDRLLFQRPVPLTKRERQLVTLLAQGLKNKEIAWTLGITEGTVKVYLSRLFHKVGANDRFELALFALKSLCSSPTGEVEFYQEDAVSAAPAKAAGPFPVPHLCSLTRLRPHQIAASPARAR